MIRLVFLSIFLFEMQDGDARTLQNYKKKQNGWFLDMRDIVISNSN